MIKEFKTRTGAIYCDTEKKMDMQYRQNKNNIMDNYEELKSQAADLVCSAARKETIQDGFDTLVADYVAAKVHDAFEIGWNSAITNSINLIKKLE